MAIPSADLANQVPKGPWRALILILRPSDFVATVLGTKLYA